MTGFDSTSHPLTILTILVACLVVTSALSADDDSGSRPYGLDRRIPWTTSRVAGSPEPPPPYRVRRAFPNLTFNSPLLLTSASHSNRLFIGERAGRLLSFVNEREVTQADDFIDLAAQFDSLTPHAGAKGVGSVYGLTFAPDYPENPVCYICYTLTANDKGQHLDDGTRVSRFRVITDDPPRVDPTSEEVLITWLEGGHNGGCLKFGPDGYLYMTAGDGAPPNPPDPLRAGQDVSNLLSTIMRIDVSRRGGDLPYAVPNDNPFVDFPGVRPEIWAYGFRNPWKMSFDPNGGLWVGDVGWELYEMVYRIESGGNYGWSIMEGPQPVRPQGERGPTVILPPAIDFPHSLGASVTGGYVYRGKRLPALVGKYIYGDYVTHRIWAADFDENTVLSQREIVDPSVQIVAFGEDNAGELYLVDFGQGAIYELEQNTAEQSAEPFPQILSDTGLFVDVAEHSYAPGVIPFSVNTEHWADGTSSQRFVAIPGTESINVLKKEWRDPRGNRRALLEFPTDSVVGRTLTLESGGQTRRLETQILHFNGQDWKPYSYAWNDEQSDARLVPAAGTSIDLSKFATATGSNRDASNTIDVSRHWRVSGRAECRRCHNSWVRNTLAFTLPQLNRPHDYGSVSDNQIRALAHIGLLTGELPDDIDDVHETADPRAVAFVDPYDESGDLEERARSYLHVNCAHCHSRGAGGTATIDLRFGIDRNAMKLVGATPVQGTFKIPGAALVKPGRPYDSVLFYRMSKIGTGRMPHVGSDVVDEGGTRLVRDWIAGLDGGTQLAELQKQESRLARELSADVTKDDAATSHWLDGTPAALRAAHLTASNLVSDAARSKLIATATTAASPEVRDLFERFLPQDQRTKRLGAVVNPEQILSLTGSDRRGRELFFRTTGIQCRNCHRIEGVGSTLGPELDRIGRKYKRPELLETILEPSRKIDPKYLSWIVETSAGRIHTGLMVSRSDAAVVLRDARDRTITVPASEIEEILPQNKSLMPELLLRDMTAEQVADLLAFLSSLK